VDINDPFIQKALLGECKNFRYREVKDFIERHEDELGYSIGKEDKIKIVIKHVDPSNPLISFVKFEKPHGGEKFIDKRYIRDFIRDLSRAGRITEKENDDDQ